MNTLFTYPGSFRAQKILIAAQYSNVELAVESAVDAKTLKSKSALGTAPVLVTPEGPICQSNAIAKYVAGDKLFGSNAFESAQVSMWVDYSVNNVEVPATIWVYPIIGLTQDKPEVTKQATADLKKAMMTLENHLKTRSYMVGESVTYADVALVSTLLLPFKFVYAEKERKAFPCVVRWFTTCVNQPQFKKVIGSVVLCQKVLKAPAPVDAPAPVKQEKKKAAKPAPKPVAADAEPAPVKKAKNPLELLPPTKFVMDTWKKTYSNPKGDDYYGTMTWFWENYDPEGFSLYTCKYKYNEENKVAFMVGNLVGGFIQRCDEIRKYAFGTMQVIGKEGDKIEIVGAWLFRGNSETPILDANPGAEYYEWTKVDHTDPAKKQEIADLWCADETLYGQPIMDGKVFK